MALELPQSGLKRGPHFDINWDVTRANYAPMTAGVSGNAHRNAAHEHIHTRLLATDGLVSFPNSPHSTVDAILVSLHAN